MKPALRLAVGLLFLLINGASANFAIFQASGNSAAVTCVFSGTINGISGGNCSGAGGGSSLFTAGTCNGSTDDSSAFASFNSWATGTWQGSHVGQIELLLPGSTCFVNGSTVQCSPGNVLHCPFVGIKNLRVVGQGAAQTTLNFAANTLVSLGGLGLFQDNQHSARTASANVNDTCAALLTPAQASLFTVGNPIEMDGLNTQASIAPFGFPPNPSFWDYLHVASVDSSHQCDGVTSGASVHFTSPLTSQYLSTWPLYNSGSAFEIDAGGPATLYALDPSWDVSVEFDNMTITYPGQIYAIGRSATYNGVTFNSGCAVPTQNQTWTALNSNFSACGSLEVDKIIDTMIATDDTFDIIDIQSGSPKLLQLNTSSVVSLQGTPVAMTGAGNTFSSVLKMGVTAFGRSKSFTCSGCSIASLVNGSVIDSAGGQLQASYTMTGGVIASPNGTAISAVQNNAGAAQLVVTSSAGWTTGQYATVGDTSGAGSGCPSCAYDGQWQLHVDDATHVTLIGSTFVATSSGYLVRAGGTGTYASLPWAVPAANIMFEGANGIELICQIVGVTQDATFTYVTLSGPSGCLGGFPADATAIVVHPAPKFNCAGCTGADPQVAGLASAPTDAPIYSYQTYTYTGAIGTNPQNVFTMWGTLSSLSMNVTANASVADTMTLREFNNWGGYLAGSAATYGATVDAHVSGNRVTTPTGTKCNGSPGSCGGSDSFSAESFWFGSLVTGGGGATFTADTSASCPAGPGCPSVTITIQTSQGVVNYLLRRDLPVPGAANDDRPVGIDLAA